MKKLIFILTVLTIAAASSQAFALSHYQSRRGFYLQLGGFLGGGNDNVAKGSNFFPKSSGSRAIDFGANVGMGFGLFDFLTIGGDVTWIGQPFEHKIVGRGFNQNIDLLAACDLYVFSGVTVGVAAGVAVNYTSLENLKNTVVNFDRSAAGFGLKGSVGYEGFVSGSMAVGGRFYYLRNFYEKSNYDSFGAFAYLRWY